MPRYRAPGGWTVGVIHLSSTPDHPRWRMAARQPLRLPRRKLGGSGSAARRLLKVPLNWDDKGV
jgi:hypothetical protein